MKHIGKIGIACLLLLAFASCGPAVSDHTETVETTSQTTVTTVTATESVTESTTEVTTEITTEITTESEKQPEVPQKITPTIEKTVCFSHDGVTVTAMSYEHDDIWGDGIKFLIENNGKKPYSISTEEIIVNGCMMPSSVGQEVAAGKKAYETLHFSDSFLEDAAISCIEEVELYFYMFDSASFETVYRAPVAAVRTNLYGTADRKIPVGNTVLYEKDGLKITADCKPEESLFGMDIQLYIENHGEKEVNVTAEEVSVNGFMVSALMSETVYPTKYAVTDITVFASDLEENGITKIETVEMLFHIITGNDFMHPTVTDPVTLHFQ